MVKRIILGGLLIVAAGCGDDATDTADKESSDAAVTGSSGSSGSSASSAGSSGSSSSSSSSGSGGSTTSSSDAGSAASGSGGSSGASDPGDPGSAPSDGSQNARCESNDDCADGLNCYVFGGYCSAECATDADCSSVGANYTCNARTGGTMGGFPGGGGMQTGDGGAAPTATGTCRVQCTGTSDTSCPTGMVCRSAGGGTGGFPGGGGMMGGDGGTTTGTFRCGYEPEAPTPPDGGMSMDPPSMGTTPAFGECEDDGECADGLECTAGRTGSGYCTQSCEEDMDCMMQPGSGSATLSCGGGSCRLSCAMDGQTCPDGMMCVRAGGGGGTAFCNFAAAPGGNMPGGGFPGGGG